MSRSKGDMREVPTRRWWPAPTARSVVIALILLSTTLAGTGCRMLSGWAAPDDRLSFPQQPERATDDGRWYDVNGNGNVDFALLAGDNGLLDRLAYDDDEDGEFDRIYRISDYDALAVPHLIVLIDSIPYRLVAERYAEGDWRWFGPPAKIIAPFPSMSVIIFNDVLKAPPMPGAIERYYDKRTGKVENFMVRRAFGHQHPWHRRLSYYLDDYWKVGMTYFNPWPWFESELLGSKEAFDRSSHRVVVTYVSASSGMASLHGEEGIQRCLDALEQLCVQLLYERRGAVRISIISDHGHNLTPSENVPVEQWLKEAGFNPVEDRIKNPVLDVFAEIDGLVSSFGVHTSYPRRVADAMLQRPEVQLAVYTSGDRVIIRDGQGAAEIERRDGRFRYRVLTRDVLDYAPVIEKLQEAGKVDADGFIHDRDWLLATADHQWPDLPRRTWDAMHGQVVSPPDVMFTLNDGFCAGIGFLDQMIEMASTHGGLNQINSDAMVLTMTGPVEGPLRSRWVMDAIEPRYDPAVLPERD